MVVIYSIYTINGGDILSYILKGKPVADHIKEKSIEQIKLLKKENINPKLVVLRLGDNPGDISYERSILKYTEALGLLTYVLVKERDISTEELLGILDDLNQDQSVHGILIFRPLPDHLDIERINNFISQDKDLDSMNPQNLLASFLGKPGGFIPSTALAVIELLKFYGLELRGQDVVIVNRSQVVGKPLAMLFLEEDASVSICHSKTKNLEEKTRSADIVVTALGRAGFFGQEYFNEDSIVVDVGMSMDPEGRLSGDVDYEEVKDRVKMITPVPGGLGRITTAVLIKQLLDKISLDHL